MSFGEAAGLLGTVIVLGATVKAVRNFDGEPHRHEKTHATKSKADEHAKRLRKSGRKARVVKGKGKSGKPVYHVYSRPKSKSKTKK